MKIIGAATGLGAQDPASGKGADFLFENATEFKQLWHSIVRTGQIEMNNNIPFSDKVNYLFPFFNKLTLNTKQVLKDDFPLIIGGDHSCAIGTWRALLETSKKEVGLIWFDAHLDAHTIHTTPSYAIHGMPVACLLGYGDEKFIPKKTLLPENLVIFGARSWESGEKDLLNFLNVRIYETEEIWDRGLKICYEEAINIVSRPELDFGISLDLDMFDPEIIPGVCSKERDGIMPSLFMEIFEESEVLKKPNLKAMEIVEFAPDRDANLETYKLVKSITKLVNNNR